MSWGYYCRIPAGLSERFCRSSMRVSGEYRIPVFVMVNVLRFLGRDEDAVLPAATGVV